MLPAVPPVPVTLAPIHDIRSFDGYLLDQGETSACGPTSLAMILDFWAGQPGACPRSAIDQAIRRVDLGTTPRRLVNYARGQGWRAAALDNGSLNELESWLDRGVPVQLLIENGKHPGVGSWHFVVALDYGLQPDGEFAWLRIADPYHQHGHLRTLSAAELAWRWSRIELGAVPSGLTHVIDVYLPARPANVRWRNGHLSTTAAFSPGTDRGFDWRAGLGDAYFGAINGVAGWLGAGTGK